MNGTKGLHGDNLKWLDPWGEFPKKPPEMLWETDFDTHIRVMRKLDGTVHLKLLYQRYSGEDARDWEAVQRDRWRAMLCFPSIRSVTIRVVHNELAVDPLGYAAEVQRAGKMVESMRTLAGNPFAIYFELGHEPNLSEEGWGASPTQFNTWFMQVVEALTADPDGPGGKRDFEHDIFYPGLSPKQNYLYWYGEPSTQAALTHATGIAVHLYEFLVDEYIEVRSELIRQGNGHHPIIISEAGALGPDRLEELAKLPTLGALAWHVFIVEGKSGGSWPQAYILSQPECQEL